MSANRSREPFRKAYYPNASEREQAAVISIGPGDVINDLIIAVPKLEEAITVEGVLHYSDGKPVSEKWVRCKAIDVDKNTDTLMGMIASLTALVYAWKGRGMLAR